MWKHPCAQVIFDSDPAPKEKSVAAQLEEMSQAMIRYFTLRFLLLLFYFSLFNLLIVKEKVLNPWKLADQLFKKFNMKF